jgi:tetratricopeptide (TPR) repeat protein
MSRHPAALALLVACALAGAVAWPAAAARSPEEWMAEGDQQYAQAHLPEAQAAYAEALRLAPGSFAALCRAARTESELGETQKGDAQRRTRAAAVEHARVAIKAAPDSAQGHVWLAVSLGRQALSEGPRTRLALSREIKSEVDRALALDPSDSRAWHVLAMWNVKLASLNAFERMAANAVLGGVPKGASLENADAAFQKAIALDPSYVNHRLEYGRLLLQQHRDTDAKRELEKAISLPPTSDALDARYQGEARSLLARLGK